MKKLKMLEEIRSLEADSALSPQMAQSERDRAETIYTQAVQTAAAARDHSSKPPVQQSAVPDSMSTSVHEVQFVGEYKVSNPQSCGKTAEAPALLSVDLKEQRSHSMKQGMERAKEQKAAGKPLHTFMEGFVCCGHTQQCC